MSELSEELMKSKSRSFDLDSIFSLNLSGCNLRALNQSLNFCADLWDLDLSRNQLSSSALQVIDGSKLTKLKQLNLSQNRIDSLSTFPPFIPSLHTLHLEGNSISDVSSIATLKEKAPNLRVLFFQTLNGENANPLCSVASYRTDVLAFLPQLQVLDGERANNASASTSASKSSLEASQEFYAAFRGCEKETAGWSKKKEEEENEKLKEKRLSTKEVADWLGATASWPVVSAGAIESELSVPVANVKNSLKECNRILKEELETVTAFKELEKKYPSSAASKDDDDGASAVRAADADGNFGFGGDD